MDLTTVNISGQDIIIYTDSEASILSSTMTGLTSTKFALYNDIDVILELQEQLRSSVRTIHLVHVEAHQDKHTEYKNLSPEAKLNVLMDKNVGLFIERNPRKYAHSLDAPHFPTQKLCLSGRHGTITAAFRDIFIDQFNQPVQNEYMKKHFGEASSTGANWKHVARVLKTGKSLEVETRRCYITSIILSTLVTDGKHLALQIVHYVKQKLNRGIACQGVITMR